VALWHERDISHSSVERIVLPDALQLTVYMLRKGHRTRRRGSCCIPSARWRTSRVNSLGLVFSQSVLLALVDSGMTRDDAYRIVQAAAREAVEQRRNFREVIERIDAVTLSGEALDRAFDAQRLLAHRGEVLDALTWRT
jgi:adenylosuccinate lyase